MTKNRQKCEVFSRAMGYYRPVENFNIGKREEYEERKTFGEKLKEITYTASAENRLWVKTVA